MRLAFNHQQIKANRKQTGVKLAVRMQTSAITSFRNSAELGHPFWRLIIVCRGLFFLAVSWYCFDIKVYFIL